MILRVKNLTLFRVDKIPPENVGVDAEQLTLRRFHLFLEQVLRTNIGDLQRCSQYYFDNQGKLLRPMTVLLMGQACNSQVNGDRLVL